MLRRNLMTGLAAAAAAQAVSAASHAEWKNRFAQQLRDDFRAHWKSEKEYSLAVLEAMPAEHFDFKPTPEQRSFSEQVAHFTSANMGYFVRFAKSAAPPPRPDKVTPEALRAFLLGTYDYVDKVLESLTEADFTRRDIAMGRMPAHTAQLLPAHTAQEFSCGRTCTRRTIAGLSWLTSVHARRTIAGLSWLTSGSRASSRRRGAFRGWAKGSARRG